MSDIVTVQLPRDVAGRYVVTLHQAINTYEQSQHLSIEHQAGLDDMKRLLAAFDKATPVDDSKVRVEFTRELASRETDNLFESLDTLTVDSGGVETILIEDGWTIYGAFEAALK